MYVSRWLAVLVMGCCGSAFGEPATTVVPDVAGAYEVRICKGPCEQGTLLVRGYLSLEGEWFEKTLVPEPERKVLDYRWFMRDKARGCFVLERVNGERTYAGIVPVGYTSWSLHEGVVRFNLFMCADAWYDAEVTLTPEGFRGKGYSWGHGDEAVGWGADTVEGKRIGDADLGPCIAAARARSKN
jgi:hypothetical protein